MVIDFHTHCFPERLAGPALDKLSARSGGLEKWTDGTADGIKRQMAESCVDAAVVLHIATSPSQQKAVNDFAAEINGGSLYSFGSVHPDAPDALEELERIAAMGLKGIKFHPQYQGFSVDEPRVYPLYRKAAKLGLIVSFHAGNDLGFLDSEMATPQAMARALPVFDGAPVVAAHLGGAFCYPDVYRYLAGLPIYFDTAFSYTHIPLPEAQRILEKHGTDKILFATDLPWSFAAREMVFIESLGLGGYETEQVLGGNAARLLGINL